MNKIDISVLDNQNLMSTTAITLGEEFVIDIDSNGEDLTSSLVMVNTVVLPHNSMPVEDNVLVSSLITELLVVQAMTASMGEEEMTTKELSTMLLEDLTIIGKGELYNQLNDVAGIISSNKLNTGDDVLLPMTNIEGGVVCLNVY